MTSQLSIPKVVLLANDLAPTHSVRQAIRRAGLTVTLEPVSSREEFLSRCDFGSVDLIVAATTGMHGLKVSEIVERAQESPVEIPIVVIGRDADERHVLQTWR